MLHRVPGVTRRLGTAAALNAGTAPFNAVQLDSAGKLPALDGSQLTGLSTSGFNAGDILISFDSTPPSGFVELDGSTITGGASSYPNVASRYAWMVVGSDIVLPDTRGRFLRGWAHGSGNDPDRASRSARAGDGSAGDLIGTYQADEVIAHTHTAHDPRGGQYSAGGTSYGASAFALTDTTTSYGGNETRPKNINAMFCMKLG